MIYVENSPPDPDIRIDEGIFVGQNNWKVPTDRYIRIDAGESTDNDNNLLYYEWEYNGELIEGQYIDLIFQTKHILDLTVSDPRGGSATEKFTLTGTNVPTLTLNYENLDIVVNQNKEIISSNNFGDVNLYHWEIYAVNSSGSKILEQEINTNTSKFISFEKEGNYELIASAKEF